MGREHELLEAARSGNVTVIEKLLNPRKKLTVGTLPLSLGPFPSLRRTPNPNCHDQNGDTPLHLAALNGHIDAVKMLLKHEGSANVMDNKGCYPLHLAAWSGNAEMCNTLLSHGPSLAKVNEQNLSGETALHCAAQYGHTATVAVLLPHLADPLIRNNRSESPLDLAAQYGRLDSVELLVRKYPNLLADHTESLSPLHLASRNGHRQVVQVLLEAGYEINRLTESGTALHEASIFGKQEVVRLLLKKGINANLTDSESRTVLEVLSEHKSQLSLDTGRIILDYLEGRSISDKRSSTQSASSDLLEPGYDRSASESDAVIGPDRRLSARSSGDSSSVFGATGGRLSSGSEAYFIYDTPKSRPIPPGLDEVDAVSDVSGSPLSVTGGISLSSLTPSIAISNSGSVGVTSRSPHGTPPTATPETPKKPPRRKPPSQVITSGKPSASPPRMVFINKRSSNTSSRDSSGSVSTLEKPDGNNPVTGMSNDNNNGGNNNVAVATTTITSTSTTTAAENTTTSAAPQNDNEKLCDNKLTTNAKLMDTCSEADADVANSNHQRDGHLSDVTETVEPVCTQESRLSQRLECANVAEDNNNDSDTSSVISSSNRTSLENRQSKRPVESEDDELLPGNSPGGGVLCRDSIELALQRLSCDEVEVVAGKACVSHDQEANGHVTLA